MASIAISNKQMVYPIEFHDIMLNPMFVLLNHSQSYEKTQVHPRQAH